MIYPWWPFSHWDLVIMHEHWGLFARSPRNLVVKGCYRLPDIVIENKWLSWRSRSMPICGYGRIKMPFRNPEEEFFNLIDGRISLWKVVVLLMRFSAQRFSSRNAFSEWAFRVGRLDQAGDRQTCISSFWEALKMPLGHVITVLQWGWQRQGVGQKQKDAQSKFIFWSTRQDGLGRLWLHEGFSDTRSDELPYSLAPGKPSPSPLF